MATDVDTGGHVWFVCEQPCRLAHCIYCVGGLASCTRCGASEGELLAHCPGFLLSQETKEACYSGNVIDLVQLSRLRQHSPEAFREVMMKLSRHLKRLRKETT